MFGRKQTTGFTSTQTLKTRNHFESMSPNKERGVDNGGASMGVGTNTNSILKKVSIDTATAAALSGATTGTYSQFHNQAY